MSHVPLRKEKDCLNCGALVQGRYCHVCGQENVVPKETFWHMVTHFFYDITHFDSSFFRTVRVLLFKPGLLSTEYIRGRRASYLHPIRLYVFTSAIFFLFFFSLPNPMGTVVQDPDKPLTGKNKELTVEKIKELAEKSPADTSLKKLLALAMDTSHQLTNNDVLQIENDSNFLQIAGINYKSLREYDSVQRARPAGKKDGWFERRFIRKILGINERYRGNREMALEKFKESLLHRLPYMLFISLPLFALLLKIVYIRRKTFYYADHGVFTIHLYVFTFITLLVIFALGELERKLGWDWISIFQFILFFSLYFYLYKALRNFYRQRRFKTIIKLFIISLFSLVMMIILFAFMAFFSAYNL
ncbi:MAG TPA: DUF3667 domain-containing protein [Chitinophagaceae bacterium]|nr:DUF3667 domain-containing protein [Chitinophagaceae bacterium]